MKIKYTLILSFIIACAVSAQVISVEAYSDYSSALSLKTRTREADAVGGGIKIRLFDFKPFNLYISGGYRLYSLSEEDQLYGWGWRFWNDRYSDKIDSDLRADPNLSADISSFQKMDLIPVLIGLDYNVNLNDKVKIIPSASAGIYFYTRRLYVVEEWSKYFEDEDYTFSYSYRNFAPRKSGNPFVINAGIDAEYSLSEGFSFYSGLVYNSILPTEGSLGYDDFPFKSSFSLKLGLTIVY